MKKEFLIVAVILCCVFVSMTAISASYLPSGYYNNVNIGNYQPIGAGPFNTVGFTITSPSSSSLKTEWKSELVYISYHVDIDIAYYTTTGTLKFVADDFDVPIMGDYSGHTLETPDIDTSRNIYVSVTSRKISFGGTTYNDKIPPKIITTKPITNSNHLSLTSPIKIKFSEKISKGTNFSKIYIKNLNTNKIAKSTVTSISGNTLTIKMTKSRLSLNTYQVYIPAGAVKDIAGNKNTGYVLKFKTIKY
ncbi:MAG: Ig-like domain-containing protein [Methanobacteriaceae archaeon]|nr:Ig-like domain-containing protein [Methanobacteriaceae archaeon]